jgi:hypothetical protein
VPHRKPFGKPEAAVRVPLAASDWADADPRDSADMPSADQPAILPNCRRENLLKGIVSLAAGINQS